MTIKDAMSIYIIYAYEDKPQVRHQIYTALMPQTQDHIDFDDVVLPSDDWQARLKERIQACDQVLYALSPISTQSAYCLWEWSQAIKANKPIAYVSLTSFELPTYFASCDIQTSDTTAQSWQYARYTGTIVRDLDIESDIPSRLARVTSMLSAPLIFMIAILFIVAMMVIIVAVMGQAIP